MLITFDCYGTLIDWEGGILAALRASYPASASVADRALLDRFHAVQNRLKTSEYRPYRDLLTEVAHALAEESGWEDSPAAAGHIPASIPTWTPFEDTNRGLRRLAEAGARLGILSNIDDDLLAGTLEHFDVPFDHLGTAERLESYKPAAAHFELGRQWAEAEAGTSGGASSGLSGAPSGWFHVAQSLFHDIEPATRLGLRSVWVNRLGEALPETARPVHTAPDLDGAVDWILANDHGPAKV